MSRADLQLFEFWAT
jgi:hypothetical protein